MERVVYGIDKVDDFKSQSVQCIASNRQSLFAGTTDGSLLLYQLHSSTSQASKSSCKLIDNIRKHSKDKKPITFLVIAEIWKVLLVVCDDMLSIYDLQSYACIAQLPETKGCVLLSIYEQSNLLVIGFKKKLRVYFWQHFNRSFHFQRDIITYETLKAMTCIANNSVIVGYKHHYEIIDTSTALNTRVLEIEKEHKMIAIEFPPTTLRPYSALLSNGVFQGSFISLSALEYNYVSSTLAATSITYGAISGSVSSLPSTVLASGIITDAVIAQEYVLKEKIRWSNAVISVQRTTPFILSLLIDSIVEIHDELTLQSLQRMSMTAGQHSNNMLTSFFGSSSGQNTTGNGINTNMMLCLTSFNTTTATISSNSISGSNSPRNSSVSNINNNNNSRIISPSVSAVPENALVCVGGGDSGLCLLQLIPLAKQIQSLVAADQYESAISLYYSCHSPVSTDDDDDIHVSHIHEKYAAVLLQEGEYEKAIQQYILAKTDPIKVLLLFPDFIPLVYKTDDSNTTINSNIDGIVGGSSMIVNIPKSSLHVAAAAIVTFCEHHRPYISSLLADQMVVKESQTINNSSTAIDGFANTTAVIATHSSTTAVGNSDNSDISTNINVAIHNTEILDTVYLSAMLYCAPPPRNKIIDLLSSSSTSSSPSSVTSSVADGVQSKLQHQQQQQQHDVHLQNSQNKLLFFTNRCHVESSAILLASQGTAYVDALLWLYRSHGYHHKLLSVLSEERCVVSGSSNTGGGMSRDEYYHWTSDYLHELWWNLDIDIVALNTDENDNRNNIVDETVTSRYQQQLVMMVLRVLQSIFEYDSYLGLNVITTTTKTATNKHITSSSLVSTTTGGYFATSLSVTGRVGVSVRDVVSFLENINVTSTTADATITHHSTVDDSIDSNSSDSAKNIPAVINSTNNSNCPLNSAGVRIPLTTGRAVSVAYLEWLAVITSDAGNSSNNATTAIQVNYNNNNSSSNANLTESISCIHDDYATSLIDSTQLFMHHSTTTNDTTSKTDAAVYTIYRRKFQHFLQHSQFYHPEKILLLIPVSNYISPSSDSNFTDNNISKINSISSLISDNHISNNTITNKNNNFLIEIALILSRLNKHEDVLRIYIHELKDLTTALKYCDDVYMRSINSASATSSCSNNSLLPAYMFNIGDTNNIYLCLFKVVLTSSIPSQTPSNQSDNTSNNTINNSTNTNSNKDKQRLLLTIYLAEKYFDRFDSNLFLSMIPSSTPIAWLNTYLLLVMECMNHRNKNLQVIHQLLRVREVNIRAEQ